MRVVLQRVSRASVTIGGRVSGAIGAGYCLLVGFTHGDTMAQVDWMAEKVAGLRLFSDEAGKMNLGLTDVGGAVFATVGAAGVIGIRCTSDSSRRCGGSISRSRPASSALTCR